MNPPKKRQQFRHADLVRIADDLGPSMDHFHKGCDGIVINSYYEKYGKSGNDPHNSYTVFIDGHGEHSWYEGWQLAFLRNDPDLLTEWRIKNAKRRRDEARADRRSRLRKELPLFNDRADTGLFYI